MEVIRALSMSIAIPFIFKPVLYNNTYYCDGGLKNNFPIINCINYLKEKQLIPEIGDFLLFRNNFYEVDSRVENQLFMGRDPNYALSQETSEHGDSFSIILNTHISRAEKLNLIPLRGGKYPSTTKVDGGIANS